MRIVMIGVIALVGAVLSLSFAATLPYQMAPGAFHGAPSLIGEVTIRNAVGQESYVFRQGDRIHFELAVRNLESKPVKVVYTSGATHSFLVVSENVEAVIWSSNSGKSFIQVIRERDIAPQAVETHFADWDQRYVGADGKPLGQVKPGVYRVIAESFGCLPKSLSGPGQCVSVMKTLRIEPDS